MTGPLAGIRIVDLSSVLMGPYASQILGDHGADVIKVETLAGDTTRWVGPSRSPGMGPLFIGLNRSKRSVAVDLKAPAGLDLVQKLLVGADVLLHNLRPASIDRLGLSYEAVSARNPAIIYCGVYGYGEAGPYAGKPAYDDLIQGLCAIPSIQAEASGGEPRYVPLTIADRTVGLHAVHSIAMALFSRERTGRGQRIDIPMFETMVQMVMGDHLYGRTFDPAMGSTGYVRLMAKDRRPYRTQDGHVCVLVYTDGHWRRFLDEVGRPDLKADARFKDMSARISHINEVYGFLSDLLLGRSTAEWLAAFERLDIPATRLHTPETLLEDPHLDAIGFFRTVEHPSEGRVTSMSVPTTWSGTAPVPERQSARLGQHTVEVMRALSYPESEIDRLVREGVVLDGSAAGTEQPPRAAASPAA